MTKPQKIGLVLLLAVGVGVTGYLFSDRQPPIDPNADQIYFGSTSSFPGASGFFLSYDRYGMNVDKPGVSRLTLPPPADKALAFWSPQRDRIVYYERDTRRLYIMNADGSGQPELLLRNISILNPTWSPDGSKIAFSDYSSIHVLDLSSKQTVQLTDDAVPISELTWSPDGSQIAFDLHPHLYGGGPDSSIAIVNRDGSDFVQLTPNDGSHTPRWSPAGGQILFERKGNIYVMDITGSNRKALTQDGKSMMPTWSPDGTRIAFVSSANQKCGPSFADGFPFCTTDLQVMDADGSNVVVLRRKHNERIVNPVWIAGN